MSRSGTFTRVRIYQLDEVDVGLELLPLAARRALDRAGKKVTLSDWKAQSLAWRRRLTELGSEATVDVAGVCALIAEGAVLAAELEPEADLPATEVPAGVRSAFGENRPIPTATWSALSPLDRYALAKVALKARTDRLDRAYAEIVGQSALSSHLEPQGGVRMVNVGDKPVTQRTAAAETRVTLSPSAFERLVTGSGPKGDVFGVARIAAIQAAKKTSDLIPLCHVLALTKVSVEFEAFEPECALRIVVTVQANDRTGVEMEALTAVSVAALAVYDMLKGVDRGIVIGPTQLLEKHGGRTGDFSRDAVTAGPSAV